MLKKSVLFLLIEDFHNILHASQCLVMEYGTIATLGTQGHVSNKASITKVRNINISSPLWG